MGVVSYIFYIEGIINKRADEVLKELREKVSKNIVGCIVYNFMSQIQVDFEKEPTDKELKEIIKTLGAIRYEKVEETAEII